MKREGNPTSKAWLDIFRVWVCQAFQFAQEYLNGFLFCFLRRNRLERKRVQTVTFHSAFPETLFADVCEILLETRDGQTLGSEGLGRAVVQRNLIPPKQM